MWTVYDHPSDHPTVFVARRFMVSADTVEQTDDYMVAPTLALIRTFLQNEGLIPVPRSEDDDPVILESWV